MRRLISVMHVSLDSYVAGPGGELDWICTDDAISQFIRKLTSHADCVLCGRVTFQMMDHRWSSAGDRDDDKENARWYRNALKVVLSGTLSQGSLPTTRIFAGDLPGKIEALKSADGKNILMFGSPTALHALLKIDAVDELWLLVNPKILGRGLPMFRALERQARLKLTQTLSFPSGVIALCYDLASDPM